MTKPEYPLKVKQLNVSFSEKKSADYNSVAPQVGLTVEVMEDQDWWEVLNATRSVVVEYTHETCKRTYQQWIDPNRGLYQDDAKPHEKK